MTEKCPGELIFTPRIEHSCKSIGVEAICFHAFEVKSLIWLANEGSKGNQDTKVSIRRYTFQRDTIECLLEVKEDSFYPILKMDEPFVGGS